MKNFLKNLYEKFLKLDEKVFISDALKFSSFVKKTKISSKKLSKYYQLYFSPTFFGFLKDIKRIIYSKNPFSFVLKESTEVWDLNLYLKFLEEEKIIKIKKGEIEILKKEFLNFFPKPLKEREIKKKLERVLSQKIEKKAPVFQLFEKFFNFKIKKKWDQLPISQESAIFLTTKILEYLPFYEKFLFIGDDDFISLILSLSDLEIKSVVVDTDFELLSLIENFAQKFNLKIEIKKLDIRKKIKFKEEFVGFLANPPYTLYGVKEFINFGTFQLSSLGGICFLELGDESLGKNLIFLQKFFAQKNLLLKELICGKIYYPWSFLFKEDEKVFKELSQKLGKEFVKKNPKLGASLYVFEYFKKRPPLKKFPKGIYDYL